MQETIAKMPEDEAKLHLKRCVDSGLWVPDGAMQSSKNDAEDESTKGEATASSSTEPSKPNISTEDVD